jgi:hypothetical protein
MPSAVATRQSPRDSNEEEQPLTLSVAVKWLTATLLALSFVVGGVWWGSNVSASINSNAIATEKAERELRSQVRDVEVRLNTTEQRLADLHRKIDVAVTLLERIDKKVGTP